MNTVLNEEPCVAEISDYELERGKPMPSWNHSIIQSNLIVALSSSEQWRVCSELNLRLGDRDGIPDLSIYPRQKVDFTRDSIRAIVAPTTIIEILSPTQGSVSVMERVDHYLANGVKSAWVVEPVFGDVLVCTADGKREKFSSGIVTDAATGLSVDLARIFA
jgi:Uma2 family endonuclease